MSSSPLQMFLNKAFTADRAVTAYCTALVSEPLGTVSESETLRKLRQEAEKRNHYIISGEAGHGVQREYARMLRDCEDKDVWGTAPLTRQQQFDACSRLFKGVSSGNRCLVLYYETSAKFKLLSASHDDNPNALTRVAQSTLNKAAECPRCVDKHYSQLWSIRILSVRVATFIDVECYR